MTGLDCLREELERRGYTNAQINSKVVAGVLDIVANTGMKYTKKWEDEQEETIRKRETVKEIRRLEIRARETEMNTQALEMRQKKIYANIHDLKAYVAEFNKSLEECETKEGKDRMRLAQMFMNSTNIDTKYDNTAQIIGLAGILSGGEVAPIEALKPINKKLFGGMEASGWRRL